MMTKKFALIMLILQALEEQDNQIDKIYSQVSIIYSNTLYMRILFFIGVALIMKI